MPRKRQISEMELAQTRIKERLWNGEEYDSIPALTKHGIERYINEGVPPGGFLEAVFQNNLFRAVTRADKANIKALPYIVRFIWNNAPADCHGSTDSVLKWQMDQNMFS